MEFFSSLIREFTSLCNPLPQKELSCKGEVLWPEHDYSHVILQRDTYCELEGVGFNMITSDKIDDAIVIIGKDISALSGKTAFARVCIVQLKDNIDEQALYNHIRKIDYIKYHFFPDGYMIRSSSRARKEAVRVSKQAVRNGLDFEKIGNLMIKRYKENPVVEAVKVYFITASDVPHDAIELLSQKNHSITETLNHVVNSVNFDCDTCKLKPVCDEVEGMKELHFKNVQKGM